MSLWTDLLGAEIRFVETESFGRMRIAEAGRGNGEPLFLLHGVGGHLEAYARNVVPLAREFHVIAYDHLGHGLSAKPELDYTPELLSDVLGELMDALGIARAHVSGESLGGWVAGFFAVRRPDRVLRVTLNTAGGLPILTEKGRADLASLQQLSAKAAEATPTAESVRRRLEWLFHPSHHDQITDELVATRLHFYLLPETRRIATRVNRIIAIHDDHLLPLEKLQAPTLFLWTRDNPVHDVETARTCSAQVAKGALYVMQGHSAHWPQYEEPEEFNEVTRRFHLTGSL